VVGQCELKDMILRVVQDYGGSVRSDDLTDILCEFSEDLNSLGYPGDRILSVAKMFPEIFELQKRVCQRGVSNGTGGHYTQIIELGE